MGQTQDVGETWDEGDAWSRTLDHDSRAFAAIFDRHEGRVFRHSLRLTESYHDAEDVTAASFFELWRRRDRVRLVAGSTLPWLLVTATNISRNSRRSLRRYRAVLDRLPRGLDADSAPPDLFDGYPVDDNADLYRAMSQLGTRDAALLLLTAIYFVGTTPA